jgi:VWFA-related protein
MRRFIWLFALIVVRFTAVWGQTTSQPEALPSPAHRPDRADQQITLNVQVMDRFGAAARGLQRQDFTLLDDKAQQNILSFQEVNGEPGSEVEIVLVIDAVNASFQNVFNERTAIKKFLLRDDAKLPQPLSLVLFSPTGTKIQKTLSRDGNAVAALLDQYETGLRPVDLARGPYGAQERFNQSLNAFASLVEYEASRPARKLMIWFSPGWPLLSGPDVQPSSETQRRLFHSIVSFSTHLRQANITLYSIDPFGVPDAGTLRINYYEQFLKGVSSPSGALPGNLSLDVMAIQSGGRVLNSSNDLARQIADCIADAGTYYVLSFNSRLAHGEQEYHPLTITVDKPGLRVRTRTAYYAQP